MASTPKISNITTVYLKKIIGNPVGEIINLTSVEAIIGRNSQTAQICIQDPNVSRSHCVLKCMENGWFIKDLNSVNGTYVDEKQLEPQIFYRLKDGAGIYLGPPEEAPAAFIFLTKMPMEESCEININICSQTKKRGTSNIPVLISNKSNKCVKRPSDSGASNTNEDSSNRKKIATSSSPTNSSSQAHGFLDEMEDYGNLSDCSISSLDSLRTRIKKLSSKKIKKSHAKKKDTINAVSTSASPQLKSSTDAILESKPSTSAIPAKKKNRKNSTLRKAAIRKEFALLNKIFSESESSTSETIKEEEDSQSLLNDSKILIECEPYPFSQALPTETAQKKNTNKNNAEPEKENLVEEQLKKATLEVKKLKKDKLYLFRLVKELKSEEFIKKRVKAEFQKMLEDELMCNICTEVFMKVVTLGCSHSFCEYCISEWKKKQKKCPICREKISSETKILVLDSFINKAVECLDVGTQNRRKELLVTREITKATTKRKKSKRSRGRSRQIRSDSSDAGEIRQQRGETSNSIGLQIRFSQNSSPSIQVLQDGEIINLTRDFSDLSDLSSESDVSVEGSGYFGGYGRCYNCGRRGHWANGCPNV